MTEHSDNSHLDRLEESLGSPEAEGGGNLSGMAEAAAMDDLFAELLSSPGLDDLAAQTSEELVAEEASTPDDGTVIDDAMLDRLLEGGSTGEPFRLTDPIFEDPLFQGLVSGAPVPEPPVEPQAAAAIPEEPVFDEHLVEHATETAEPDSIPEPAYFEAAPDQQLMEELQPLTEEPPALMEEPRALAERPLMAFDPVFDGQVSGYDPSPVFDEAPEQFFDPPPLAEPDAPREAVPGELDTLIAEIDHELAATPVDTRPRAETRPQERQESLVVFLVGRERYGLPLRHVVETDRLPAITPVPNLPAFVRGVANLRGEILALLDLRTLFGLDHVEISERQRILVVRPNAAQLPTGLIVDGVRGLADVPSERMTDASALTDELRRTMVRGILEYEEQPLNILDLEKLYRTQELQQFDTN